MDTSFQSDREQATVTELTADQLHPGANVEHCRRGAEEEHDHGADREKRGDGSGTDECSGRRRPRRVQAGDQILQATGALAVRSARREQAQFTSARRRTDPLGGRESRHHDDGVAHREYRPEYADCPRVACVAGRVHLRRVYVLDPGTHGDGDFDGHHCRPLLGYCLLCTYSRTNVSAITLH